MPGGLLQIISIGRMDKILMENPEIFFFKVAYMRPTMFAIDQYYHNVPITNFNQTTHVEVPN